MKKNDGIKLVYVSFSLILFHSILLGQNSLVGSKLELETDADSLRAVLLILLEEELELSGELSSEALEMAESHQLSNFNYPNSIQKVDKVSYQK